MDLQKLIEALQGPNADAIIERISNELAPTIAPPAGGLQDVMAQFSPGAQMMASGQAAGPQFPQVPGAQNPAIDAQAMSPLGTGGLPTEQLAQQAIQGNAAESGGGMNPAIMAMMAQALMGQGQGQAQGQQQQPIPAVHIPPGGPQNPATIAALYSQLRPIGRSSGNGG